jgi:hypothetical protein
MDPYNNNPFKNRERRDLHNERDANRALRDSVEWTYAYDTGADIDDGLTDDEK